MRILLARQVSTQRLLPRVDAGNTPVPTFAASVAAEFALPATDVVTQEHVVSVDVYLRVLESLRRAQTPGGILWPPEDPDADIVGSADDVDRVTAARIRRLYGGVDGEARASRRWREAWEIANDPAASAADHIDAEVVIADEKVRHGQAEHFTTEARVLKQTRGWR